MFCIARARPKSYVFGRGGPLPRAVHLPECLDPVAEPLDRHREDIPGNPDEVSGEARVHAHDPPFDGVLPGEDGRVVLGDDHEHPLRTERGGADVPYLLPSDQTRSHSRGVVEDALVADDERRISDHEPEDQVKRAEPEERNADVGGDHDRGGGPPISSHADQQPPHHERERPAREEGKLPPPGVDFDRVISTILHVHACHIAHGCHASYSKPNTNEMSSVRCYLSRATAAHHACKTVHTWNSPSRGGAEHGNPRYCL